MDITSRHGYIGPFWWINSDTSIQSSEEDPLGLGIQRLFRYCQWGTCGFGRTIRVHLEEIH